MRTADVHACIPFTASCSAPSPPRSASDGPSIATSIAMSTVCSPQPIAIVSSEVNTTSSSESPSESCHECCRSTR